MKISFSFAVIVGFPNYFVKFVMLIFIYNNVFSFIYFDLHQYSLKISFLLYLFCCFIWRFGLICLLLRSLFPDVGVVC